MQTDKIAVIELSTKAVKWLIPEADNETIRNTPFDFSYFSRNTQKTETGNGLNKNNVLDERYFETRVLPYIVQAYNDVVEADVDVVYCVATAVYRSARNINSILQIIKDATGLDVRVLTKEEEAEYTFWAYFYATHNKKELLQKPYTLLIDQGGGSTEITFFNHQKLVFRKSFEIGTTVLKNDFFSQQEDTVLERFDFIDDKYREIIRNELTGISTEIPLSPESVYCIGVGTAITAALGDGNKRNRDVHERILDKVHIQGSVNSRTIEFSVFTVRNLQRQIELGSGASQRMEKKFVSRLGLPIISEIMDYFNVQELIISGTGLWYGVFFVKLNNLEI